MRRIVIVSSDDSHYMDFWPLVKHAWFKLGLEPVLAHVSNDMTDSQDIIDLPIIEDIPVSLQAQVSRWYVSKFFPNCMVMTSDIDMMPLSKKYFDDAFKCAIAENNAVHVLSSDAYGDGHRAYPMCYNIATGTLLTKLMDLEIDWPIWVKELNDLGWGWNTDERRFYEMLDSKKIPSKKYERGWNSRQQANARLDRANWIYDISDVSRGKYIDAHMIRPYREHEKELRVLFNNIRHD
jgi:hypothetical protein